MRDDAGAYAPRMHANVYALGAIALWATLASLGLTLKHLPPFFLTGAALVIGLSLIHI